MTNLICRICHADLIDWKANIRDKDNPNKILHTVKIGYRCSYERCNHKVIIPESVFEYARLLKGQYTDFEPNLQKIFPLLQEAVELSIQNNKPVPSDIQAIFIPILRDSIYEQCTWYHSFKREAYGLSCYFSNDKVIWELELK